MKASTNSETASHRCSVPPADRDCCDKDSKSLCGDDESGDEDETRNDENNISTKRRGPRTTIKAKQLELLKSMSYDFCEFDRISTEYKKSWYRIFIYLFYNNSQLPNQKLKKFENSKIQNQKLKIYNSKFTRKNYDIIKFGPRQKLFRCSNNFFQTFIGVRWYLPSAKKTETQCQKPSRSLLLYCCFSIS